MAPAASFIPASSADVLAETDAQWMFASAELSKTPSIEDGMTYDQEQELRFKGLNFITQVGIMLKIPQITIYTGSVFFQRFLMRNSLVSKPPDRKALHHYQIAAISLFLASKVEENCRKMREFIVACCRVAQKNPSLIIDEQSKDFWRWRDTLILNEDVLLESLCFDLTIESPFTILFDVLKALSAEHNRELRRLVWTFVIDSSLTPMCLLFSSQVIVSAAIYYSAKLCSAEFPDDEHGRPWWKWAMSRVNAKEMIKALNYMVDLYEKKQSHSDAAPYLPSSPSHWQGLAEELDSKERAAEATLTPSNGQTAPDQPKEENGLSGAAAREEDQGSEEGELEE